MLEIPTERHTLENGLRVVLSPDHTTPVVAVNLWYGVGSRNEREGRTGFAHLFEHMMFQGSAHVPKGGHFELIERAGGSLNGSTWFDRTNYFETLPAHHLDLALWLESDRMGWMLEAIDSDKLENQRDVVKNERRWRYDNQPYGDWDERLQALVYPPEHPYHHPVIGSMEDIDAATLDDVGEFFQTFYVPNNAVLTICGDFVREEALERVERWFGPIPVGKPIPALPGTPDLDPVLGGRVEERVVDDVPLPRIYLAARIPTYTSEAFYAADVTRALLGKGRASRLYRSLVREQRIAKDVVAYAFPLVTGASMMLIRASGYPGVTVEALEEAVARELDALADADADEVARAVALTETSVARELEQVGERADLLSMFELYFDDPARLNTELDRYRSVTTDQIRTFADSFLGPDNRAVLAYVPEGSA